MNDHQETLNGMRRLKAGDTTALAALYDRFSPLLYSVALRIVGRAADAEDVLQQVWMQVWRSADRYDASRGSVVSWLLAIARSRALDLSRSLKSRQNAELHAEPPGNPAGDPVAGLEESQRHARVRRALSQLDAKHREVLELAYFEGLAQSEISRRLDAPLGTVKSWTRRGLVRLRELMEGRS